MRISEIVIAPGPDIHRRYKSLLDNVK